MSEATPGPWTWDGWNHDRAKAEDGYQGLDGSVRGHGIGAVLSIEDYGCGGGPEYSAYRICVSEANATLIARAPALRDALGDILAFTVPADPKYDDEIEDVAFREAVKAARAALTDL